MPKKKTDENFKLEMQYKNPNVIIVGNYISTHTALRCKCRVCGHEWMGMPSNLLCGYSCPVCSARERGLRLRTSPQEFVNKMRQINPNICILEEYRTSKDKILCKCLVCGNEWRVAPSNLLNFKGCPECGKLSSKRKQIKTDEAFRDGLSEINPKIEAIDKYAGAFTKILCRCGDCGREFYASPTHLLNGKGCPYCRYGKISNALLMSQKCFEDKLYQKNKLVHVVGEYKGSHERIDVICDVCGCKWSPVSSSLLSGYGCPNCAKGSSKGEKEIISILNDNIIDYQTHKSFDDLIGVGGSLLSYDFFLPLHNLLIEFQGVQHEIPIAFFGGQEQFKIQKEHDNRKQFYAKCQGYNLLEIWYYDLENIEDILKSNNII